MNLRSYLQLVRLPNLFTATADVLAGYLFAGGQLDDAGKLVRLVGASVCLYAGGVALNDVCDADRDATNRINRPIPSGRIAKSTATWFAVVLLGVGVSLAALVAIDVFFVALVLVGVIVLYDLALKSTRFAPSLMGMCRALNLGLGMVGAGLAIGGYVFPPLVLMWLFVSSVTVFARSEAESTSRRRLQWGTGGVVLATCGMGVLVWLIEGAHQGPVLALVLLATVFMYRSLQAIKEPTPVTIQRAVTTFITGLILFDACLVWAVRGPLPASVVAALLLPMVICRRAFRMT